MEGELLLTFQVICTSIEHGKQSKTFSDLGLNTLKETRFPLDKNAMPLDNGIIQFILAPVLHNSINCVYLSSEHKELLNFVELNTNRRLVNYGIQKYEFLNLYHYVTIHAFKNCILAVSVRDYLGWMVDSNRQNYFWSRDFLKLLSIFWWTNFLQSKKHIHLISMCQKQQTMKI